MFSGCLENCVFGHAAIEMTACNLRSLLVAAIFLSNCITWTASRHHYTHSLSGHRIRHRRQGEGLYLSASYVLPGGEGSGWGEWGEVSPCSRTCGGGVASQKRICLQIGPDGQPYCTGGSTKYFSCQTQDCPDGGFDFRAQQCSEFDDKEFRGFKYKWVPYTKAPNPCELNCMPHGERFYYRHKEKVIDGTRCNEDSFDVCVNGHCRPVGCDMMLGSKAEEDKCRVCRGNGESCRTYGGIFDSQDLVKGYNDILLIPQGSTTIVIEEIAPSRNYLALRAKNGTYYLNGHYHIDFPRSILIAGALWYYERSPQGFTAPDKLRTQGPTTEPLYLSLLLQDDNVGIQYEYSVPNTTAPPTDKQYGWVHEEFTPCSDTCGGGFQTRNVSCRSREELEIVDDGLCDDGLKPPTNQSCNSEPCPAQWVEGDWGNCSKRCGEGGVRSREVRCQQIVANGHPPSIIDDKECLKSLGPKPDLFEKCNEDVPCPTWFVGRWKNCDHLCDEGKQTRQVVCHQRVKGRVELLGDEECADEKPETEKPCFLYPCDGADWVATDWTGCDSCLSTNRSRLVVCATKFGKVLNETFCILHNKPVAEEPCDKNQLPACEVQWYATQWSKCSVECGEGTQNRKVFCGLFDGASVLKVDDSRCAGQTKYNETKKCAIPKEKCPSQWYAGPWEKCSKDCDGGVQDRRVMCFRGDKRATDCDGAIVPESTQICNTGPCNEDTLMPVVPSAPSITTQLPYCDDEDYPEVGLEADELLTTMQADSPTPSFAEFESTADLGSGSGMGSTFFDELSTTESEEGSGFTFTQPDTESSATESSTTDTSVTDSSVTESSVTDSSVTEIGVTDSSVTESSVTDSSVTEISATDSSVTESSVTDSNVTDSGVTDSSITESSVTDSSVTDTSVTDSSITATTVTDSTVTDANVTDTTVTDATGPDETTPTDQTGETGTSPATLTTATSSEETDSSTTGESNSTAAQTDTSTQITTEDEAQGSTTTTESSSTGTGSTDEGTGKTTTDASSDATDDSSVTTESTTTDVDSQSTTITSSVTDSSDTTTEDITTQESQSTASSSTDDSETESISTDVSTTITSITNESSETATDSSTTEGTQPTNIASSTTDSSETTDGSQTTASLSTTSDEADKTTETITTEGYTTEMSKTTDISETTTESLTTDETQHTTTSETSDSSGTTTEGLQSTTDSSTITQETKTTEGSETTTALEGSESTTKSDSTNDISGTTTETGSTTLTAESTTQVSTTESTDSSSTISGSESTEADVSTMAEITGSEGSTTEGEGTDTAATTESSTDSGSTTEYSTTSESTDATTEGISGHGFTASSPVLMFTTPLRQCIPRPRKCQKSDFGCCPDGKTPAVGPFDEGCQNPKTCKDTRHGCCPDGVSVAEGPGGQRCPTTPCADTLFGCCLSDNKTAAEGNDQEGCPPPCFASEFGCCADNETEATGPFKEGCPESSTTTESTTLSTTDFTTFSTTEGTAETETGTTPDTTETTTELEGCPVSEFGCCYDNETAATGPDAGGCPCNATEFGCCPDGLSPAQGVELEGCQGDCRASKFGCCEDGETPAHGPDSEGCCLLQAFGCCPDNRNPAQGPNHEGCGCQYAAYGCCPDNITIAQGPDNQGCGCQYSEHGCCPDRHTEAFGPDFKGCGCSTFQFGCCPDGVTTAIGPGHQGCHCQYSKYGCCGDDETPATGPNGEGCDCSASKFGCCADGKTDASGPKFLGCTDVPEDKQAVCSMGTDPGPGHNFSAFWYYDLAYGGCSRFWYGGTGGNGNRFATKDDCEDVCVQPAPKDACKLPGVKGPCEGDHIRWYFNSTHEQCMPFRYGGCLGNANNYDTRELCQSRCEAVRSADQCSLPIEEGPCVGNYSRWGYDKESGRCEAFTWGGCGGTANRFRSEIACLARCHPPGTLPPPCSEPQEPGNCSEKLALWSFSTTQNRCLPFYYTGCGGNNNRFDSRQGCEETCPRTYEPDKCTLPAETGECANYREKWFYDTAIRKCRLFYYGGCGGNENNFNSEVECENTCSEAASFITTTTARPTELTAPPTRPTAPPTRPTTVSTAAPPAPEARPEFCFMEIDAGPCTTMETRWAYDSERRQCQPFQYGGCGGNQNSFPSEEYCTYYCHPDQDICQLPMQAGPCDESVMRWFYDAASDSCSQFTYGGCQGNENRFETREACENRCRTESTPKVDVRVSEEVLPPECQITQTLEPCANAGLVWYYDQARRECVSHQNQDSGDSCKNTGVFVSQEACERSCGAFRGVDPCSWQPDPGSCNNYETLWYFDAARGDCNTFVYTGCNGNENRFRSREECEGRCKAPVSTTTTPAPRPEPPISPECVTPSSLQPCGDNVTVYYYDSTNKKCERGDIGGCGYSNSFRSAEECERRCGVYVTLSPEDICTARLDPGPCRGSFQKFYWDSVSGKCDVFAYGGCRGGPNRFDSLDECEDFCGALGPDNNEVLDCRVTDEECSRLQCVHGVVRTPMENGCEGCTCAQPPVDPCEPLRRECDALNCPFGVLKTMDGGCERCSCAEDPCAVQRCGSLEHCEVTRYRDNTTQQIVYSTRCVGVDENEITPDCGPYLEECSQLRCQYGVQSNRLANGCDRCSCVTIETNCDLLTQECTQLKCTYGMERVTGADGCVRCRCSEVPCQNHTCAGAERCVVIPYRDALSREPRYSAECRLVNKPGYCPMDNGIGDGMCRSECNDDADCRGVAKCCVKGCKRVCLPPELAPLTTTYAPDVPRAPEPAPPAEQEPEVSGREGGKVTLRCLFHGNPPPKITWSYGQVTIDGDRDRYRLLSSGGALEIVSLYRNDSGVYMCVADNGLGVASQSVTLVVNDPVETAVGIAGDEDAAITGELGRPLVVRCLAYGYPVPMVSWIRDSDGSMVPFNNAVYEARGNVLLIRRLEIQTLDHYTCHAYNGYGKPASWRIAVQAYRPPGYLQNNPYLVGRGPGAQPAARGPPQAAMETTVTTTTTTTELPSIAVFRVPVSTHIAPLQGPLTAGDELRLSCEVDGFPDPEVYWTKDGVRLQPDDRITIAGDSVGVSRLSVGRVSPADGGAYACRASNAHSSHADTAQVTVNRGLTVPAKCTDNPFFANCDLIVRSNFCTHKYYSKFCCKSCVEAGQLDPRDAEMQADQPYRRK